MSWDIISGRFELKKNLIAENTKGKRLFELVLWVYGLELEINEKKEKRRKRFTDGVTKNFYEFLVIEEKERKFRNQFIFSLGN